MRFLQALQALKDSTPLSYSPHALQHFQCEWEGPKVGHVELVEKDGVMVYQQVRCAERAVLPQLLAVWVMCKGGIVGHVELVEKPSL
jgi:hypothetical protein